MKNILHFRRAAFLLLFALLAALLTGCADKPEEGRVVKLGVTGAVYEELWRPTVEALAAEGITLELVQFSDFALPNNALNSGDIDLNAFQHQIYLDNEVEQQGYKIQSIGYTFIIPLNIYSHKVKAISDIKDGDVVVWHYINDYAHEAADWFDDPDYPALGDGTYYNGWLQLASSP